MSRRIRTGLLACGSAVTLLAGAAMAWRVSHGGAVGPTQIEIAIVGVLILIAGAFQTPARRIGAALAGAFERQSVVFQPITGRQRAALAGGVLLALSFRVVMIDVYWPSHQIVSGMPLWDAEMARNLLKGRGWTLNWAFVEKEDRAIVERGRGVDPQDFFPVDDSAPGALDKLEYVHTPGYSLWLATSFVLGGSQRFIYSQWMQAALDSLATLLVFGIGRRLWSNGAGVAGALLYALSPGLVYLAIQPVAAATDSFWVLLISYGCIRLSLGVTAGRSPAVGVIAVVLGGFCGTAMNTLAFTLALAAGGGAALIGVVSRPAWKVAGYLVLAHFLVVLLLVPWGLRNQRMYGRFAEMRQSFWQHTWETLGAIPNPWGLVLITESGGKDDAWELWINQNCPQCDEFGRQAFTRNYLMKTVFLSSRFPAHMLRMVAMQAPGLLYVSRLPADNPYVGTGIAGRAFEAALRILNITALFLGPAALLGLVLVTVRRSTADAAWIGLVPNLFLILFSLCLLVEHRKTTQAYGYLTALAGIACAACGTARAGDD